MKLSRLIAPALAGVAALVVASCDSQAPSVMAPRAASPPSRLVGGLFDNVGLLACTPMTADSTTAIIGSDGGTITVGPHRLDVPAGALDSSVTITAIAPSGDINRVQLLPTGLTFNRPATLTLSYANCSALLSIVPRRVAYIDSSLNILDLLPTADELAGHTVSVTLNHFSDYAVAW
jgi:hypothetical protein